MQESLSKDILISGTEEQVEKAKKAIESRWINRINLLISDGTKLPPCDSEVRLAVQDIIDMFNITAIVVQKGHRVWSHKRIISNLHQVKTRGPEHLNNYFYEFIKEVCGSKLYFNKAAWIRAHPTVDAFGQFFLKNDYGKDASEYIPDWKTDAKRIVTDIERFLFPFQSYVKNKNKRKP
jgi:hypothetical protein